MYAEVQLQTQRPALPAGAERCMALMADAGIDMTNRTHQGAAVGLCDGFWLLQAAVEGGGGVSAEQITAGVEGLGSSFEAAGTFSPMYGEGRHDGPDEVRVFTYDEACSCFAYSDE